MKERIIGLAADWLLAQAENFIRPGLDGDREQNIRLKLEHTRRVELFAGEILKRENIGGNTALEVRLAATLHDSGRFLQLAKYGTFCDADSVNHGKLGAESVEEAKILDSLEPASRKRILEAIRFHNAYALPKLGDPEALIVLKVLRDADKLDIWRVLLEFYETPEGERSGTVGRGLPESSDCKSEIMEALREGKSADISSAENLTELKLVHLSWLYHLNYRSSLALFLEAGYAERLRKVLPDNAGVREAAEKALAFAGEHSKEA